MYSSDSESLFRFKGIGHSPYLPEVWVYSQRDLDTHKRSDRDEGPSRNILMNRSYGSWTRKI